MHVRVCVCVVCVCACVCPIMEDMQVLGKQNCGTEVRKGI